MLKFLYISLSSILLATLFCSCSSSIKTLYVQSADNRILAVYIDSNYIGSTPLSYKVNQDTIDGALVIIKSEGSTVKTHTLHSKPIEQLESEQKNKRAAATAGLVAMGAGFVLIPYPFALASPLIFTIPNALMGSTDTDAQWNVIVPPAKTQSVSVSSTTQKQTKKSPIKTVSTNNQKQASQIHQIPARWFSVTSGTNTSFTNPRATYANEKIILSSSLCYDNNFKTVWFQSSETISTKTFPVPIDSVEYCDVADSAKTIPIGGSLLLGLLSGGAVSLATESLIAGVSLGIGASYLYILMATFWINPEPNYKYEACHKPMQPPMSFNEKENWFMQYPCNYQSQAIEAEPK